MKPSPEPKEPAGPEQAGATFFDRDPQPGEFIKRAEEDFLHLPRPVSYRREVDLDRRGVSCVEVYLEGQWDDMADKHSKYILFEMTRKYVKVPEQRTDALLLLAGYHYFPESLPLESTVAPPNWLDLMAARYGWEGMKNPYAYLWRWWRYEEILGPEKAAKMIGLVAPGPVVQLIEGAELPASPRSFTVETCVKYHRRAPAGSKALGDDEAILTWICACIVWDSPSDAMELFADALKTRRLEMGRDDGVWHDYVVALLACFGAEKKDGGLTLTVGARALLQYLVLCPSEQALDALARIWADEGLEKADKEWIVGLLRGVLADQDPKLARGVAGDWRKVLAAAAGQKGREAFLAALGTLTGTPTGK